MGIHKYGPNNSSSQLGIKAKAKSGHLAGRGR